MIITSVERENNIIKNAVKHGFSQDGFEDREDLLTAAIEFILHQVVRTEEECEVKFGKNESYTYNDGYGYSNEAWGEIVNWDEYQNADAGDKIVFATEINSYGEPVDLYIIKD